jgi:ACS family tartrate transporter-like MFS transporter
VDKPATLDLIELSADRIARRLVYVTNNLGTKIQVIHNKNNWREMMLQTAATSKSHAHLGRERSAVERATIRKVIWRLLPFLSLLYLVAMLDRVNVSFAAPTMNSQIGLSATLYGEGAGIFFLSYVLFEIPSNLALQRVGARLWIARIMFTWGILAAAMAFIHGLIAFFVLRFLLGAAEAGFFPGVILYLTFWFPQHYRARVIALFSLATPISTAVGSIFSAPLLALNGTWGFAGWQWLFLVEGVPAIVLAFVTLFYLTDRAENARWLVPEGRAWLVGQLELERRDAEEQETCTGIWRRFAEPRVLVLTLIWLCRVTCLYGVTFFLPQVVKTYGGSNTTRAFVAAIPFVCGTIGMLVIANSSDRLQERRWHLFATFVMMAGGLGGAAAMGTSIWSIVPLSIATIGYSAMVPCFWPLPSQFLTGAAAAGGIAFINAAGNIGGIIGPYIVGRAKDATHGFALGLALLGLVAVIGAVTVLLMGTQKTRGASR